MESINNIHDSYITISVDHNELISYQQRLLRKYKLKHILSFSGIYEESNQLHYYNISDSDSLAFALKEQTFSYKVIEILISDLLDVMEECHDYMLDEKRLDLRPEFIYFNRLEKRFAFVYRPILNYSQAIKEQCFDLFDYLLRTVNSADYKAINLTHRLRIAVENERLNRSEIQMIMNDVKAHSEAKMVRIEQPKRDLVQKKSVWDHIKTTFRKKEMSYEIHSK